MTAPSFVGAHAPEGSSFPAHKLAKTVFASFVGMFAVLKTLRNRQVAKGLRDFSDYELADIGLTRLDIERGLAKPLSVDPTADFWRCCRENSRLHDQMKF